MSARGQRSHQQQPANVYDGGKQERIGASRSIAAKKVAGAPDEHRRQTVNRGCKLWTAGHV